MTHLEDRVRKAVNQAPALDLHTHLFAPSFSGLNLWGIDELLTYHYLIAEVLRAEPTATPEWLLSLSKPDQADFIWETLFVRRTPLSEATSGVVTVLTAYGLDPTAPDLREARAFFAGRRAEVHLDNVLNLAGVSSLCMTNDPLDPAERAYWESGIELDSRFQAALRIDPIVNGWDQTAAKLESEGYRTDAAMSGQSLDEVRRFLDLWIERMGPRYLAVSLPDTFTYPDDSARTRLLKSAVLPACHDHELPLAIMIGVRRGVNPRLGSAGDGMGKSDLKALESLVTEYWENRFLITTLDREDAYGLCVLARKFSNVLPFGCWWFMNNPSLVEETTLMRLEMLGASFVPQHSDARVLDQLVYKWRHARASISSALTRRYEALEAGGLSVGESQVERDARDLMSDLAAKWLGIAS